MKSDPLAPASASLFEDALKGWGNDDLMLNAQVRKRIKTLYPEINRVLDWPGLRDVFRHHDKLATAGKRTSRNLGAFAILLGGSGVALLALVQAVQNMNAIDHLWVARLSIVTLAMMVVGTLVGIWHWLGMRARDRWLSHRFWTERLRQLHFQVLVNNIELAVAAIDSDEKLAELEGVRDKKLAELEMRVETQSAIRAMLKDVTERDAWLVPIPSRDIAGVDPARLGQLLEALEFLRVRVQLDYVSRAAGENIHAPGVRARLLKTMGDVFTLMVVPVAALGAILYLGASAESFMWAGALIGGANALSALGLMARAADDGLQNSSDAERYEWYAAALEALSTRFDNGDAVAKIDALRELEVLAYQELRRFIGTHRRARFLM
ncbi:MAG: hypothetical protein ACAH11_11970 [Sphingomonas sp.]